MTDMLICGPADVVRAECFDGRRWEKAISEDGVVIHVAVPLEDKSSSKVDKTAEPAAPHATAAKVQSRSHLGG
jgi:hypothetical protein